MPKFQIRWDTNAYLSSTDIEDFLLHKNKNDIEIIFKNGNTLRYLGNVSITRVKSELNSRFNSDFEIRIIE